MSAYRGWIGSGWPTSEMALLTQSRLSTSRQLRNRLPERPRSLIPRSLALPFPLYLVSLPLLLNTLLLLMPQVFKVLIPDYFPL
jgi:hypothetical protein